MTLLSGGKSPHVQWTNSQGPAHAYAGTNFATFKITVPESAAAGFHALQLGKLLPVGINFIDGLGSSIDDSLQFGSATLEILPPRPPETINDLAIKVDGSTVILSFTGVPGERYAIRATTDLKGGDWRTLATVTAPENGAVQFVHALNNEIATHFYRVEAP